VSGNPGSPALDVVVYAEVGAWFLSADGSASEGRSHSLYFCDAVAAGNYAWFETAFMDHPMVPKRLSQYPFALPPAAAAGALGAGMNQYQVAWPFTALLMGDLDEFVDRWVEWFAAAADGQLAPPSNMPERPVNGTWRRR
jgi:serine/threonine-protein kinase